ncbi:hypothetical protein L1987_30505 [Smallanthus sonchifolius]|uniref:Uncharacterized protein n=1 Tax=Smallanthus sonchifolius TaxID=185202 RepID=A0ACB9I2D4_9ASTR|nr:hypothetical protein L1987_30505 [Smallanthus sonchifolius]
MVQPMTDNNALLQACNHPKLQKQRWHRAMDLKTSTASTDHQGWYLGKTMTCERIAWKASSVIRSTECGNPSGMDPTLPWWPLLILEDH